MVPWMGRGGQLGMVKSGMMEQHLPCVNLAYDIKRPLAGCINSRILLILTREGKRPVLLVHCELRLAIRVSHILDSQSEFLGKADNIANKTGMGLVRRTVS